MFTEKWEARWWKKIVANQRREVGRLLCPRDGTNKPTDHADGWNGLEWGSKERGSLSGWQHFRILQGELNGDMRLPRAAKCLDA